MDNINYLIIINNIIDFLEDRKYIYIGTDYNIIKNDKHKIDKHINFEINNYTNIIKNIKYSMLAKKNNKYILILFLESFYTSDNFDINYIFKYISNRFIEHVYWDEIVKVYIICPDKYENKIIKKIQKDGNYIFEAIKYTKLLYNPTQHIYFPKHEKIKNYEKKYEKYNLKLPVILKSDIACKWYDYQINDIIKITRKDNSICYRIVKNDNFNDIENII